MAGFRGLDRAFSGDVFLDEKLETGICIGKGVFPSKGENGKGADTVTRFHGTRSRDTSNRLCPMVYNGELFVLHQFIPTCSSGQSCTHLLGAEVSYTPPSWLDIGFAGQFLKCKVNLWPTFLHLGGSVNWILYLLPFPIPGQADSVDREKDISACPRFGKGRKCMTQ